MANVFDILFGKGAKPVRRDAQLRMTVDADGKEVIETVAGQSFTLSQDGSIDRVSVVPDRFYHCGCNAEQPMGGRCAEGGCRRVSCHRCYGRCNSCQKPLCLEHSVFLVGPGQQRIRLCHRCEDENKRRRRLIRAGRALLSPFVRFDRGNE